MIYDLQNKREICDKLKAMEAKIRASESISYQDLIHTLEEFKVNCNEVDLRNTEEYLQSIVKKVEPILSNLPIKSSNDTTASGLTNLMIINNKKGKKANVGANATAITPITIEELTKHVHSLKALPFSFEETNDATSLLKRSESLAARMDNGEKVIPVCSFELFKTEYNNLGVKIGSLENFIKKAEQEKAILENLQQPVTLDEYCSEWSKAFTILKKIFDMKCIKTEQAEIIFINSIITSLLNKSVQEFGNKRRKERTEEIWNKLSNDQKYEFLHREGVKIDELEKVWKRAVWLKENAKNMIDWDRKFMGKNKSIEFIALNESVSFMDKIVKEQLLDNIEQFQRVKALPFGSF